MIKTAIETAVREALTGMGATGISFVVERPADMSHGDYSTNAALVAAKQLGKSPRDVAEALAANLAIDGVEKVEIAGPGFINFQLSAEVLAPALQKIPQVYAGKKIMVEYTDPNPFKEFHIGHLMSNAIGESIARLFEATGAKVLRANYQGDVGPHVAKTIWAVQNQKAPEDDWGAAYVAGNKAYEEDEAAKKEILEINKKVYDRSDAEVNNLYDTGRAASLAHFEEIYKKLGTQFNQYFFESETSGKGLELVKAHPELFVESDGATVYHGPHTRVFVNSQGLPTYEAKDLGLLQLKQEAEQMDQSITVTASEQAEYFKVVLDAAARISEIEDIAKKTTHVTHGMMRFAEGKMSSRKGNVITGESLLADMADAAKEKMQGRELKDADVVAQQVAVGAIKYTVLKQGSGRDIIFDPEKSLSLEGDSGPYIQYAHTRAVSLIKAAQEAGVVADVTKKDAPGPLEKILVHFPEVVERAAQEMEPHFVTTYITELAGAFNSWYASTRVIGGDNPAYNLALAEAVETTLAQGLKMLGIPAPEEM